jgi:hypothetical protein
MKSSLTAGVLMITLGLGQLLSAMGVVPEINWVWTMFLAAAGVLVFVLGGINKATIVLGPFFLIGSILSILRETGRIEINVELPMLVILIGILILIAHHPSLPTPAWLLPVKPASKE